MKIGSAPVSFGIHGGVESSKLAATPEDLLKTIADAGYSGSELGPPGFFGSPKQTVERFKKYGLEIIGAYVPLHLSQDESIFLADLENMKKTLEELAYADGTNTLAILADEGDPSILAEPFRAPLERGLSKKQWDLALERLHKTDQLAKSNGVNTSFHPHFGTYVEQANEIDYLLENSNIQLCLDTGHFALGGADPLTYLKKWFHRINHLHIKDINFTIYNNAKFNQTKPIEAWWYELSVQLGEGDIDLFACIDYIKQQGYSNWLVIEQDAALATQTTWPEIVNSQHANLKWLTHCL